MSVMKRLDGVYKNALRLNRSDCSKFVLMSDCHRSDGSSSDLFRQNMNVYVSALRHYYRAGFTYFELGDGDEMWANKDFSYVSRFSEEAFHELTRFYESGRYHMLYGNHDLVKRRKKWAERNLRTYKSQHNDTVMPLFPGIKPREAIVLGKPGANEDILLIHGHQADFFNDKMWPLARFLVRHIWRPAENIGMRDPFSPSNNPGRKSDIDKAFRDWSEKNRVMLIAGHTHRTVFPKYSEPMYFNDGCCVYPRFMTAIEIDVASISLVKWRVTAGEEGLLRVTRSVLHGPFAIEGYFDN